MKIKSVAFILLILLSIFLRSPVLANEGAGFEDFLIGATFKAIAKAYITACDIKQFKQKYTERLKRMDENEFQRKYAKVFIVLNDLPQDLRAHYGINEQISRRQAIREINSLDKQKIYEVIDLVPDEIIAAQFKIYLKNKKQDIQNSDIVMQIKNFWEKIVNKTFKSGKKN